MLRFERRKNRSDNRAEALRLYLDFNAAHTGVKAAAISDENGLLIGGVGDVDLEVLAAVGPVFVFGQPLSAAAEERVDSVVQNNDLYASKLNVCGETWVLTTLGARFPEQRRAERAFSRILAA